MPANSFAAIRPWTPIVPHTRRGESYRRIHSPLFARGRRSYHTPVMANHAGEFIRRYSPVARSKQKIFIQS